MMCCDDSEAAAVLGAIATSMPPVDNHGARTWRHPQPETSAVGPAAPSSHAPPVAGFFCLHADTRSCVAGVICSDCGYIMASAVPNEGGGRAGCVLSIPVPATANAEAAGIALARKEWDAHTNDVHEQPAEVMQHAFQLFSQAYANAGGPSAVGGNRAKALVLQSGNFFGLGAAVCLQCLLYSLRLLHGSDAKNEAYVVRALAVPIRRSPAAPGGPPRRHR